MHAHPCHSVTGTYTVHTCVHVQIAMCVWMCTCISYVPSMVSMVTRCYGLPVWLAMLIDLCSICFEHLCEMVDMLELHVLHAWWSHDTIAKHSLGTYATFQWRDEVITMRGGVGFSHIWWRDHWTTHVHVCADNIIRREPHHFSWVMWSLCLLIGHVTPPFTDGIMLLYPGMAQNPFYDTLVFVYMCVHGCG